MALLVRGEREEIAVTELGADRRRFRRDTRCALQIAGRLPLKDDGQEQISTFGAAALVLDEALRACEPAAGCAELSTLREVDADPESTPDGSESLPRRQMRGVGAVKECNVVVQTADHE